MSAQPLPSSVPVPYFIKRQLSRFLLPQESIESVFDQLDHIVDIQGQDSIWSKEIMSATVSIQQTGTLDMFFPKLSKQEPPQKLGHDAESSESEFEMALSKKSIKNQSVRKETLETKNSIRPSISSEMNNELSFFHSTALGKMHENVPLCGSEVEASSDSESIDSIPIKQSSTADKLESLVQKNNKMSNLNKTQELEAFRQKSFQADAIMTSGNTKSSLTNDESIDSAVLADAPEEHSQDMFPENQNQNNLKSNLLKEVHNLSGDDEDMIPLTQAPIPRLSFNLSNEQKLETKQKCLNSFKSNKGLKLTSVVPETLHDPPSNKESLIRNETFMEHIQNKMSLVQLLPNEGNTRDLLHLNEITEEDEVFLIQCPKDVDISSLVDVEIPVDGSSVLSLKKDGKTVKYECFSMKENSERTVNLVLPDHEQNMKLGSFPLAGNIILSEATEQPELRLPEVEPPKKVPFPEGLEEICSSFSVSDTSCNISGPEKKKKKKKHKHINYSEDSSIPELTLQEEVVRSKKKKRKRELLEDANPEEFSIKIKEEVPTPKKKRKREQLEAEEILQSLGESNTAEESIHHETELPPEKKRKKKKSSCGDNSELIESFNATTVEGLLEQIIKKKKKKKKKDLGDESYIEESKNTYNQEFNDSEMHSFSSDIQMDDTVRKKKKKKKSHDIEAEEDCFIKPDLSEVSFAERHKKKHKKKSIE